MHHNVNLSWPTSLHISTKVTTHPTKYGNGWYGVSSRLNAASSCFFATTKQSKIMFICRPSAILVVKLPHCVLRANIQKTCHHRECITMSTCLGLPFSTKATTHRTKYGNGWYGVSSSLNAASSCFSATIKRSKIMFICRPSAILVVKLPHCVLRANIQKTCHHRECITMSTCLGLPFSTKATTHPTKYGNGWYGVSSSLNAASSCFFATTKRSKIVFICRPSTILVVKLPHCVLRANIQKICHHRKCIKKSIGLGLPFSTKATTTHPNNYGNGWYGVSSSFNAASSCFSATTKRSKIVFICRPSAILVVKLPHCVLRANIQEICHHMKCITQLFNEYHSHTLHLGSRRECANSSTQPWLKQVNFREFSRIKISTPSPRCLSWVRVCKLPPSYWSFMWALAKKKFGSHTPNERSLAPHKWNVRW